MTLDERRRMLYSPDFWRILSRQMPPFGCDYEDEMLAALAKSTRVPVERVKAQYSNYLRAVHAIKHPGTGGIN